MPTVQIKNHDPRTCCPGHLRNNEEQYWLAVQEMRKAMTAPFVVAPMCTLAVRSGVATAGTPVTADSLPDGEGPAEWRLQRLVREGRVLERY